ILAGALDVLGRRTRLASRASRRLALPAQLQIGRRLLERLGQADASLLEGASLRVRLHRLLLLFLRGLGRPDHPRLAVPDLGLLKRELVLETEQLAGGVLRAEAGELDLLFHLGEVVLGNDEGVPGILEVALELVNVPFEASLFLVGVGPGLARFRGVDL